MSKYHEDRSNFSESIVLKFTKVLERNRKEGIISFNELTLKIIDLINSGKSNKEICNELNIDYIVENYIDDYAYITEDTYKEMEKLADEILA